VHGVRGPPSYARRFQGGRSLAKRVRPFHLCFRDGMPGRPQRAQAHRVSLWAAGATVFECAVLPRASVAARDRFRALGRLLCSCDTERHAAINRTSRWSAGGRRGCGTIGHASRLSSSVPGPGAFERRRGHVCLDGVDHSSACGFRGPPNQRNRKRSRRSRALVPEMGSDHQRLMPMAGRRKLAHVQGTLEMELAGLEPATSWVRSRRSPN
jgi:hypothetical protein